MGLAYAYIDPPNHPNVGKYGIHGVSGQNGTTLREINLD